MLGPMKMCFKFEDYICTIVCIEKDSFRSWVVCFVCFLNFLVIGGITGPLFGIMVPYLHEYFKGEDNFSALLTIGSLQSGTMLLSAPLAGMLISTFSNDYKVCIDFKICALGYLIAATSSIVSSFSPNVMTMAIIYGFCSGAGLSILQMMFIVSCDLSFEKKRNIATSIARSGQLLGMVVFTSTYDVILQDRGWKFSLYITFFILMTLMCFGGVLVAFQGVHEHTSCNCPLNCDETNRDEERRNLLFESQRETTQFEQKEKILRIKKSKEADRENLAVIKEKTDTNIGATNIDGKPCGDEVANDNDKARKNITEIFSQVVVRHRSYLMSNNGTAIYILIGKFLGNGSIAIHNELLPTFLMERGISSSWSDSIVSIENFAGFLSGISCGLLATYYSNSRRITPLNISSISLFSAGIVYLFMVFTYDFTFLELLCVLSGILKTPFISLGSLLWFKSIPIEYYTIAVAYAQVFQGLGSIILPPVAGLFADIYGDNTSSMTIESIASISCGILFGLGSYVSRVAENK